MAQFVIGTTPAELTDADSDTWYSIQNTTRGVVYVETVETAPTDVSGANRLGPNQVNRDYEYPNTGQFKAEGMDRIWIWGDLPGSIVYDKAE